MEKIQTNAAPAAIGPYSQGIKANGMVFVSGQLPMDPSTGKVVEGSIEEQTRRVLDNIKAVLEAAGSSMEKVVQAFVFMADLSEFQTMNQVYESYFKDPYPARVTVQVASLPKGVKIEISVIALAE